MRSRCSRPSRYLGGHTATVDVTLDGRTFPVDTGFLVFNDRTYPKLDRAVRRAGRRAAWRARCRSRAASTATGWNGPAPTSRRCSRNPANALRPSFWRMLADIARFNRERDGDGRRRSRCGRFRSANSSTPRTIRRRFATGICCRWPRRSGRRPRKDILEFPLPTFVRFCRNHGLLQITDRPRWRTVEGGGRVYVEKIAARLADVRVATPGRRIARTRRGRRDRRRRRPRASVSTTSCSPATATRRWRCSPTRRA